MRMAIDGWIYIAVGDYGMHEAKGTDGTVLTMLGGGIVRVRPDGSELEIYTHGLRNIYDVAIDPLMNIYTRGNTNDGGGWNVRFIHNIQIRHNTATPCCSKTSPMKSSPPSPTSAAAPALEPCFSKNPVGQKNTTTCP